MRLVVRTRLVYRRDDRRGAELAEWVSKALDDAALPHDGPHDREGWAWEPRNVEGKVTIGETWAEAPG